MALRAGIDAWGLSDEALHTGMGQYTRHLVTGLASERDVEVVAYGAPHERRPAWLPAPVEWRAPELPLPGRARAIASRLFALRTVAKRDRLDLFHAPAVHVRPSSPPVPSMDCPLVVTLHDLIPLTYYGRALPARSRWFYRWNVRRALRAAVVVTVSEAARSEILASSMVAPSRLTVIANGAAFEPNHDDDVLRCLDIERPYVLYAGSYEPRKNLRGALEAYALLAGAGNSHGFVGIVDAGSGHKAAAQEHLRSSGIGNRVRLLERVSDSDLRSIYTFASVLLFPSFAEGFGFPPLQAAACGVPAVVSDIAALRETMGDAAIFIDPHDSDSIAAGLRRVLDDTEFSRILAARARTRAAEFTWQRSVERHMDAYRMAAGGQLVEQRELQSAGVP